MPAVLALLTGLPQFWSIGVSLVHHVEQLFGRKTGGSKAAAFSAALGDLVNTASAAKSLPVPSGTQDAISTLGTITTTVLNVIHGNDWPSSLAAINAEQVAGIVESLLPTVTELAGNDDGKITAVTSTLLKLAPALQGLLKAA
jgi:CBS domain containing-hemolysin-like protein